MILNNSHVRGIFKYSDDVYFEKDDFIVDGNCIYICTSSETSGIKGKRPSEDLEHLYYSEYPGNKISNATEYYDYLRWERSSTDDDEIVEDKYISAHTLCQILEDMYFGFGDNGILYDHIIYDPNTGIDYSVRDSRELIETSTGGLLDRVLRESNLNNGLLRVSRGLQEVEDILDNSSSSISDVVILKQYTYLNSGDRTPFRVQELMDPEHNELYYRFAEGSLINNEVNFTDSSISEWKNIYFDRDAIAKLNAVIGYYNNRIAEEEAKVSRLSGKFCFREVYGTEENGLGTNTVYLRPGETRDIKCIGNFTYNPCVINVLVKVTSSSNIYRNYSVSIDLLDIARSAPTSEVYYITDDIYLTCTFDDSDTVQVITISTSSGVIKNIYYRDNTLNHVHSWVTVEPHQDPDCVNPGYRTEECSGCHTSRTIELSPLGHSTEHVGYTRPTCVASGNLEYWHCRRCDEYFSDERCTNEYPNGLDDIIIPLDPNLHTLSEWSWIGPEPTCTQPGTRTRHCTNPGCNYVETQEVSGGGHDFETVPATAPGCGDYGCESYKKCRVCERTYALDGETEVTFEDIRVYPTGAHNLGNDAVVFTESSFSDDPNPQHGNGLKTCLECGNKIEVLLPYRRHVFSELEEIEQFSAYYDQTNDRHVPSGEKGTCIECSDLRENYNWVEFDGNGNEVSIQDNYDNHVIEQHSDSNYVSSTCTDYGYWVGTCSLCGEQNVHEINWNDPPKHRISDLSNAVWTPNDCTHDATYTGRCDNCHNEVSIVDSSHLRIGHVDNMPAFEGDHICDACGEPLTPQNN